MERLLRTERYKLFHNKIFWITLALIVLINIIILSGSSVLHLSGYNALTEIIKKEILTILMACIYGGLFVGGDFADRTMYHGLMAGKSRDSVLWAKSVVFAFAMDGMLYVFPFLLVLTCTVKNGWGIPFSAETALHLISIVVALLFLGFAIGAVTLLAAVSFRDVGRTIGVPVILYFVMILFLNSAYAPVLLHVLPVGTMILVVNGTVSPAYGMILGIVWSAFLFIVSMLIFRHAELC